MRTSIMYLNPDVIHIFLVYIDTSLTISIRVLVCYRPDRDSVSQALQTAWHYDV